MSLSCLRIASCCILSSVFWLSRSHSSSLVISVQGSSPVPCDCTKQSPGETAALRVWEGWSKCWWSHSQVEQVTCTRLLWNRAMPHVPMLEENGLPYTSTAASPTLRACAMVQWRQLRAIVWPSSSRALGVISCHERKMSCIFSCRCWAASGFNCF